MAKNYILFFLLIFFSIAVSKAQDPGTANLTHLWTFEDGTANDEVGGADGEFNGNNILVEGGDLITFPSSEFDPPHGDSWLDLPGDSIDIGSYDEVSISAWFTPDTLNAQWNTLWFFGDDGAGAGTGSDGIALQARRNDNHARFWFSAGNPSGYLAEDGVNDVAYGNYNKDTLYHVVCVVNIDGELKMYHNGVLVGTTPLTTNPATGEIKSMVDISPNFARFAHSTYAADYPWTGAIHEIAIYNKALSDEEVAFLFEKGITKTSVEGRNRQLPKAFTLQQNYPNPFNPGTRISFDLPKESRVKIKVYDMLGKEIALLLDEVKPAGQHSVAFDGTKLSSGIYLYTMDTGDRVISRKMVLLK
ncbi:MAG TPA: LamG-like jellyroll fold domain-containing protein [Ignavibacteriaceae bacterium]|nr:LamG-like jellyroll fold domain-containing protein [Ignavibacteriaceae bacterium]